jgi:hypothetical protein
MQTSLQSNSAAVAGITTAFSAAQAIALNTGADVNPMPASGYLAHLELNVTVTAGSPTVLSAFLAWDAAGDVPATGVATSPSLQAGLTTAASRGTGIAIDSWYRFPTDALPRVVYLFLKTDAGTITVPIGGARLVWTDAPVSR